MELSESAKAAIPDAAKDLIRPIQSAVSAVVHSGDAVECPVCESGFDTFLPFHGRPGAQCPKCRTMERHRLLALFLARETDLFSGSPKRLLHVAPEWYMQKYLKEAPGIDYLSGDIASPHAMVKLDVTDLEFDDAQLRRGDVLPRARARRRLRPGDARAVPGAATRAAGGSSTRPSSGTGRTPTRTGRSPTPPTASGSSASATTCGCSAGATRSC